MESTVSHQEEVREWRLLGDFYGTDLYLQSATSILLLISLLGGLNNIGICFRINGFQASFFLIVPTKEGKLSPMLTLFLLDQKLLSSEGSFGQNMGLLIVAAGIIPLAREAST